MSDLGHNHSVGDIRASQSVGVLTARCPHIAGAEHLDRGTDQRLSRPSYLDSTLLIRAITYHVSRGTRQLHGRDTVISAHQCRTCAADCATRAQGSAVSLRRAAILRAMSTRWAKLAELTEQYEAAKRQEGDQTPH